MSEVAQVPQLRFPEFSGEWEDGKLGNYGNLINGLTYSPDNIVDDGLLVLRSSNVQNGQIYLNDNVYVNLDVDDAALTKEDDILICVRNGSKRLIGKSTIINKNLPKSTHGAFMTVFRGESNKFISHWFHSSIYYKEVHKNLGATINSINGSNLKKFKTIFPLKPEQQKIAAFLTAVDNKIEQLSKKQELLDEYKKGLMQQIFSQAVRFKADDGSEFPDWEEKKLGDVSDCLDNRRQPLNGAERNQMKGDIPYYGANGIVDYVNDYIFDEELVLLAEDGGNFNDFSSKPIAQKISGKAWVNNHAHILKAKNIIATDFLFYSLVHKDIRRYIVGGSRAKLI
jgi:type I restriction enzyme S subunit